MRDRAFAATDFSGMSTWLFFPEWPLPRLISGERGIYGEWDGGGPVGGDWAVESLRDRPRPRRGEASDAKVAEPVLSFLFALLAALDSPAFFFLTAFASASSFSTSSFVLHLLPNPFQETLYRFLRIF